MGERYGYIMVGPHGAYALMDDHASTREIAAFKAQATKRGHTVEHVTVEEACRRHREFLKLCARARAAAEKEMAR